jgi:hypothetical protein
MRHILTALLFGFVLLPLPAAAQHVGVQYVAQVPLLPLPDGDHGDIEDLARAHWRAHYDKPGELGFGRDRLRAGRFDLDGDGRAELFLMVDAPAWTERDGKPFVIATWAKGQWRTIGWGWSDEDRVFVTDEKIGAWRSVDSVSGLIRWSGRYYQLIENP